MLIRGFEMTAVGAPLSATTREVEDLPEGRVLVAIAGCGVCHTDLGFLHDGVPTRHPLPLILGHEISGTVIAAGEGAEDWIGKAVIVPAVMPCGTCDPCRRGRGSICPKQVFPGNDLDGGFATHVVVPSLGLCPVPGEHADPESLAALSVVADAVTTPYQAIHRAELAENQVAVFVGIGGVGGFGVQIAAAMGARVIALDVDDTRLERMAAHGADFTLNTRDMGARDVKKALRTHAKAEAWPTTEWRIFETSGTPNGQETAFALLNHGAYLGVVGFTPKPVTVRLSNLMAFDARAEGSWGCVPELYPAALELVLEGKVQVEPFVQRRPLSGVNDALSEIASHAVRERVVLVPDLA